MKKTIIEMKLFQVKPDRLEFVREDKDPKISKYFYLKKI